MASVCGGGSATICSAESSVERAPPVGCGPAAVESVWDTGQADRSVSVCPQSHASSSQQGLCSSQVSRNKRKTVAIKEVAITYFLFGYIYSLSFCLFQVVEDRFAQGDLLSGFCVYRAWGLSSSWRCTSNNSGVQLPTRTLWFRKVQTNPHLQSGLKVSPTSISLLS